MEELANGAFIPDPPGPDDDRFSRAFKPWREWNVGVNFLTNLHCGADESRIFCAKHDPPDVLYQKGRFEIKEIMDRHRRRHDEVKASRLPAVGQSTRPQTVTYIPQSLTPDVVGRLVLAELNRLSFKPTYTAATRSNTDLLFYVNLLEHWFEEGPVPCSSLFSGFGWRSVSAVIASSTSLVLIADGDAPPFLQANAGKIRERWEPLT